MVRNCLPGTKPRVDIQRNTYVISLVCAGTQSARESPEAILQASRGDMTRRRAKLVVMRNDARDMAKRGEKKSSDSGVHSREIILANRTFCEHCKQWSPGALGRTSKAIREELDWTQGMVKVRGGPSVPMQSRYERGDAGIGAEGIRAYASAYGVDYEDMHAYLEERVTLAYFLLLVNQKKDRHE